LHPVDAHYCLVLSLCLSVTLVYCDHTVGWIKIKLGMQVGLGPGHIVLDGDSAPPSTERGTGAPTFEIYGIRGHVYCGQTAGWIKMPFGTDIGIGPGHIVLDGDLAFALPQRGTAPSFRPMSIVAKRSPISATAEHLLQYALNQYQGRVQNR